MKEHDNYRGYVNMEVISRMLNAINQIRNERQRPTEDRIVSKLRSLHKIDKNTVLQQLNLAVQDGLILKMNHSGMFSYNDPNSVKQARYRRLQINDQCDLMKTVVRSIKELSDENGSDLQSIRKHIELSYDVSVSSGVNFNSILEKAMNRAVALSYLQRTPFGTFKIGSRNFFSPVSRDKPKKAAKNVSSKNKYQICLLCNGSALRNSDGMCENLLTCYTCSKSGHPSCLNYTPELAARLLNADVWYCAECKCCDKCNDNTGELLFRCDGCDKGFHRHCVVDCPKKDNDIWLCSECKMAELLKHTKKLVKNAAANVKRRYRRKNLLKKNAAEEKGLTFQTDQDFNNAESFDGQQLKVQGLVDSLSHYFTPTNKRRSRVAQASLHNSLTSNFKSDHDSIDELKRGKESDNLFGTFLDYKNIENEHVDFDGPSTSAFNPAPASDCNSLPLHKISTFGRPTAIVRPRRSSMCLKEGGIKGMDSLNNPIASASFRMTNNNLFDEIADFCPLSTLKSNAGTSQTRFQSLTACDSRTNLTGTRLTPCNAPLTVDTNLLSPYPFSLTDSNGNSADISQTTLKRKRGRLSDFGNKVRKRARTKLTPSQQQPPPSSLASTSSMISSLKVNDNNSESDNDIPLSSTLTGCKRSEVSPKEKKSPKKSDVQEDQAEINDDDRRIFKDIQQSVKKNVDMPTHDPTAPCPSLIQLGHFEIRTWCSAPYPQEYARLSKLYICEFCLKYIKSADVLKRHMHKCTIRHPPGNEIYRKADLSIFEVDGAVSKIYCQNLCLLAKLFLDHKTLYYDVDPFVFNVLTRNDDYGCHLVGYFSKEKYSSMKHNVSCIVTLPQYQKKGYGRFLIDFSYLLSRKENQPGTPEKPLSDLGRISYYSYWLSCILEHLYQCESSGKITVKSISRATGMTSRDIIDTLNRLRFLTVKDGRQVLEIDWSLVRVNYDKAKSNPNRIWLDDECLRWHPIINSPLRALATFSSVVDNNNIQRKLDDVIIDGKPILPQNIVLPEKKAEKIENDIPEKSLVDRTSVQQRRRNRSEALSSPNREPTAANTASCAQQHHGKKRRHPKTGWPLSKRKLTKKRPASTAVARKDESSAESSVDDNNDDSGQQRSKNRHAGSAKRAINKATCKGDQRESHFDQSSSLSSSENENDVTLSKYFGRRQSRPNLKNKSSSSNASRTKSNESKRESSNSKRNSKEEIVTSRPTSADVTPIFQEEHISTKPPPSIAENTVQLVNNVTSFEDKTEENFVTTQPGKTMVFDDKNQTVNDDDLIDVSNVSLEQISVEKDSNLIEIPMTTGEIADFPNNEPTKNGKEICDSVCYSPGEPPILTRVLDENGIEPELDGDHSLKTSDRPPALSPQPAVFCDGPDFVSINEKPNFGDVFSPISEPVPQIDLMSEPALIESPSVSTTAAISSSSIVPPSAADSTKTAPASGITPLVQPSKESIHQSSSDSMMVNLGGDANDSDQESSVRLAKEQNTFDETSSITSKAPNLLPYNATPTKSATSSATPSSKPKTKDVHSTNTDALTNNSNNVRNLFHSTSVNVNYIPVAASKSQAYTSTSTTIATQSSSCQAPMASKPAKSTSKTGHSKQGSKQHAQQHQVLQANGQQQQSCDYNQQLHAAYNCAVTNVSAAQPLNQSFYAPQDDIISQNMHHNALPPPQPSQSQHHVTSQPLPSCMESPMSGVQTPRQPSGEQQSAAHNMIAMQQQQQQMLYQQPPPSAAAAPPPQQQFMNGGTPYVNVNPSPLNHLQATSAVSGGGSSQPPMVPASQTSPYFNNGSFSPAPQPAAPCILSCQQQRNAMQAQQMQQQQQQHMQQSQTSSNQHSRTSSTGSSNKMSHVAQQSQPPQQQQAPPTQQHPASAGNCYYNNPQHLPQQQQSGSSTSRSEKQRQGHYSSSRNASSSHSGGSNSSSYQSRIGAATSQAAQQAAAAAAASSMFTNAAAAAAYPAFVPSAAAAFPGGAAFPGSAQYVAAAAAQMPSQYYNHHAAAAAYKFPASGAGPQDLVAPQMYMNSYMSQPNHHYYLAAAAAAQMPVGMMGFSAAGPTSAPPGSTHGQINAAGQTTFHGQPTSAAAAAAAAQSVYHHPGYYGSYFQTPMMQTMMRK